MYHLNALCKKFLPFTMDVWITCGTGCVCVHISMCVCIHIFVCMSGMDKRVKTEQNENVLWAFIPCFCLSLFLSCSCFLFTWEKDNIPHILLQMMLELSLFLRTLSNFFLFLWTCDTTYKLPSCPAFPPSSFSCSSSSQLYLSDLWPHKNLILTSGPPLLLSSYFPPRSSLVQSSGDPLLLFKSTAQCVYYCLCTCMLHALLLPYWSVSLCKHKSELFVSD